MKPVRVQLVGNAAEEFEYLNKTVGEEHAKGIINSEHQQLLKSIKQKIELIKANPQYGDAVPKALIRKSGYDVDNLWVVDLTGYWRMFYTLRGGKIEILCFILEIVDHNKYNKIFGYMKK
ncbi:MAG: hypothetical protein NT129_00240 [Candidatus Aenigmarchaeota archaeon]|nr:hypothetical protein [Candidatus Aenigmarchaeota archaeon]